MGIINKGTLNEINFKLNIFLNSLSKFKGITTKKVNFVRQSPDDSIYTSKNLFVADVV